MKRRINCRIIDFISSDGKPIYCPLKAEFEAEVQAESLRYLCKDHAQLAMIAGIKIKPIYPKAKDIWDLI